MELLDLPLNNPILVDTPSALKEMVRLLAREPRLAVDTEANSLHAYQERVCLIQFSTPQDDYLVDPLALGDLTHLGPLFSDPQIEIIFHASEYDMIGLQRDFSFTFANIFDTMLAARILGYKSIGLASLLAEKFGLDIDKHNQKANWGKRPLSPELIDYARLDTHYLIRLRDILETELHEKGRWDLAVEDFQRACYVNNGSNTHRASQPGWERIKGRSDLTPRQLTILNELCRYRARIAERYNRPVFKVVNDAALLKLAQSEAQTLDDLAAAGLTELQINRMGKGLLTVLTNAEGMPLVRASTAEKVSEAVVLRLKRLKSWRKKKAGELEVESDVILPRTLLTMLAEKNPRTPLELERVIGSSSWRLTNFGGEILHALGVKEPETSVD